MPDRAYCRGRLFADSAAAGSVGVPWLALTVFFGVVAATLCPEFCSLALFAQALTLFAYGALSMRDMTNRVPRLWIIFGLLWLFRLISSVALLGNTPSWVLSAFAPPHPVSALFMLGGFALGGIILIASAFYKYYVARLPEVANRALFWGINSAYFMIGIFLVGTGANALGAPGSFVLLFGTLGAAYAQMNYRVLDIRRELTSTVRIMILLLITTLVIFGALIVACACAGRRSSSSTKQVTPPSSCCCPPYRIGQGAPP
ncbi:MAG: hypothetical protein IPO91_23045 [Chloroflexi bacterium]|nr:hypothetical protein [Chloroflexota bacterium]